MSPELEKACGDLCIWAGKEGVPMFLLHVTPEGDTRFIGHQLPGNLIARMLRSVAGELERQMPDGTIQ
jgi:hypothetical protein